MADSTEDLLAKLKAQYRDAPVSPVVQSHMVQSQFDSVEPPDSIDRLLADIAQTPDFQSQSGCSQSSSQPPRSQSRSADRPTPDDLLADLSALKVQYAEHDRAEARQQEQQQKEKQRQQETLQQQRRAALQQRAQQWLQTLDPHGGEGMWFEEFARRYPSRLEAAIDYLGVEPDAES